MPKLRLSRLGTLLSAVYAVPSLFCLFAALYGTADSKVSFVLLQLPITLQGSVLQALGLGDALASLHWPAAYLFIALPTALALYGLGALASSVFAAESRSSSRSNNAA